MAIRGDDCASGTHLDVLGEDRDDIIPVDDEGRDRDTDVGAGS